MLSYRGGARSRSCVYVAELVGAVKQILPLFFRGLEQSDSWTRTGTAVSRRDGANAPTDELGLRDAFGARGGAQRALVLRRNDDRSSTRLRHIVHIVRARLRVEHSRGALGPRCRLVAAHRRRIRQIRRAEAHPHPIGGGEEGEGEA